MKSSRKKNAEPTAPAASSRAEVVKRVVALSAPLIAVLNSPALAAPNAATSGPAPAALDPVGLIAAGTGIATVGAYQLMKLRARKGSDRKE